MTIEIFSTSLRLGLIAGVVIGTILIIGTSMLGKRQLAAMLLTTSATLASALLVEKIAPLLIRWSAPSSANFNDYRWILRSSWGAGVLLLALFSAAATLLLTAISTRSVTSPWRWSCIVGLRAAALMVALVLFLQPAVQLREVTREPNHVAILIDDSQSMELVEHQGQLNRRERAAKVLKNSEKSLRTWASSHILDFYTFSTELLATEPEQIGQKPSEGGNTLLRQSLTSVRKHYRGDELAGIVVISDGVVTGDLAKIGVGEFKEFAKDLQTPVYSVWAARPGLKDLSVTEIRADEFAFVRTVTRVEATITATGYKKRKVEVTLWREGKKMRRKWVNMEAGDSSVAVAFEFTPPHVGKFVYKISIPVGPEETVADNNSAWFVMHVIRDKIRVLQVAGQPSWDVRSLRGMLKQNPNVDLISFFILRNDDNIRRAPNSELSLIPFPTRELFSDELPSFDLVILQNFNYGPYGIGRYLESIRSYVEGGGGLVMIGGPLSFASGDYAGTPIAKVLPVFLPSSTDPTEELLDTGEFRPQLTKLGEIHPITALRYDRSDNRRQWNHLPPLEGINKVLQVKKGASVLAVHPSIRDKSKQPMPVIVAGNYGKGRSLAITTDSLWKWDFVAAEQPGNDGRHYLKFWDNAIRWLIQDPELRYLHVSSNKNAYAPGQTISLSVRLQDQDYTPLTGGKVKLSLYRGFDPLALEKLDEFQSLTGADGKASKSLGGLEAGVYRIKGQARVRGVLVTSEDIFLVRATSVEHQTPAGSEAVLKMVSQFSGGRYLGAIDELPGDLRFTEPKLVRVDRRSDVALWSRPYLLVLALLFLGLEWVLRQRAGTL